MHPLSWPKIPGLLCTLMVLSCPAYADSLRFPGTRSVGMGGTLRAAATSDLAPQLNPSGMSLARSYSLESTYQYTDPAKAHDFRVSAVDSTSGFNLGGGLFYEYHRASPQTGGKQTGHLGGLSLSFPFADKIFIGATGKYQRIEAEGIPSQSGFTYDVGITVRPISILTAGFVAHNLHGIDSPAIARSFGGGVALAALPALLLAYDMVWEKVRFDPTRNYAVHAMGGMEISLQSSMALRAGGGREGISKNTYFSAGFSAISAQAGALDFALRRDLSGSTKNTVFAVTARLFVPTR